MGDGGPALATAEIAHAVVLPPPVGAMPGDPDYARVLFMCRSNCADVQGDGETPGSGNRSFVWKPGDRPADVTELDGPAFGYIGSHDAFCSGHTVAADGAVLVVGGLNYVAKCWTNVPCIQIGGAGGDDNTPVGHNRIYRLDTSLDPPSWITDATWPAAMGREHWYPTAILLDDGSPFIAGHFGAPSPHCPVPNWPYGSNPATEAVFERIDMGTALSVVSSNTPYVAGCGNPVPISVGNYPRLHLLSDGRLLFGNAREDEAPWSRAMDLLNPPCTQGLRWEDTAGAPAVLRDGGSSVHILVRDPSQPFRVRDLVIALGGATGDDDAPCPTDTAGTVVHDSVEQYDPLTDSRAALAPMLRKRVNQNAVLLPTGSVLVVGGTGLLGDTGPGCEAVVEAEEFFPAEIFGGPAQGQWRQRAEGGRPRTYHSVAGLLPDGRAFVAGGAAHFWPNHAPGVYHTVEVFSPEYVFRSGRPDVTLWPDPAGAAIDYSTPASSFVFSVDVTLACDGQNTVSRVVLIRSSSTTHAFDMNQRYVELDFEVQATSAYPDFTLDVTGPASGYVAPPGYYLLFVIDANGLPSEGRWVRVEDV